MYSFGVIRPRLRRKLRSHSLYLRGGAWHAIMQIYSTRRSATSRSAFKVSRDTAPPLSGVPFGEIEMEASQNEGVARGPGAYENNFKKPGRMIVTFTYWQITVD